MTAKFQLYAKERFGQFKWLACLTATIALSLHVVNAPADFASSSLEVVATPEEPAPNKEPSALASEQVSREREDAETEDNAVQNYEENPSEIFLQEAMGYQVVDTDDGPKLIYNQSMDQTLQGRLKLNPLTATYAELEMQHVQRVFHEFLSTQLTPAQRKLLQLHLIDELTQSPLTAAANMANELNNDDLSPESTAFLAKIAITLYYYRSYIYMPLVEFSNHSLDAGQEGIIIPQIITMTQHILNQYPQAKPFLNALLVAPVVGNLAYYSLAKENTPMALASGSYAAMLGLSAQISAGILSRHTSFNSYAAGMFAGTYRNWQQSNYWSVLMDGLFTLHYVKNKRPLIWTAMGAMLLYSLNIKPGNTSAAQLLNPNFMMPIILSACLTEDWGSRFLTGFTLLFNQYALYATRDYFLLEGKITRRNQPYWGGLVGATSALALTTYMYWNEFPTMKQAVSGISSLTTELGEWVGYLTFMKGVMRPDWERSGVIHYLTRKYVRYSPFQSLYHGELNVESGHNFGSQAEAIEGNRQSIATTLTEWMSTLLGVSRTDRSAPHTPEVNDEVNELEALNQEFTNLIRETESNREELSTPEDDADPEESAPDNELSQENELTLGEDS
ncbi:hypothetical protein [Parendozoicomonas sp. Alg238-R29]|uniref:hypothetical protein n=1 Tax=Parendozoicomonas sp. Alg238-R29 TaxID=2993446 RepID=UPI00248DE748|nr:hypothetical protein [Parendozoicomonas sp. Alg238-R29]